MPLAPTPIKLTWTSCSLSNCWTGYPAFAILAYRPSYLWVPVQAQDTLLVANQNKRRDKRLVVAGSGGGLFSVCPCSGTGCFAGMDLRAARADHGCSQSAEQRHTRDHQGSKATDRAKQPSNTPATRRNPTHRTRDRCPVAGRHSTLRPEVAVLPGVCHSRSHQLD